VAGRWLARRTSAAPGAAASAPKPAPTPALAPTPSQGAVATGPPVILQIVVPASAGQNGENLIQYISGHLSPGQTVVKMARVPGPVDEGACVDVVATAPVATPVSVQGNPSLCVELNGTPPKSGRIDVSKFTNKAVQVTVTLWP
jgi:hypothetical protein